jgi:putative transposase
VKRSLLTDGAGIPLGVVAEGANRHDMKLVEATLESIPIARPAVADKPQHLCMDKGYDFDAVRKTLSRYGYLAHIRRCGQEAPTRKKYSRGKARRWVVERTHSWFNRFRRILIRWEKKADNYLALLHLCCGLICFRTLLTG